MYYISQTQPQAPAPAWDDSKCEQQQAPRSWSTAPSSSSAEGHAKMNQRRHSQQQAPVLAKQWSWSTVHGTVVVVLSRRSLQDESTTPQWEFPHIGNFVWRCRVPRLSTLYWKPKSRAILCQGSRIVIIHGYNGLGICFHPFAFFVRSAFMGLARCIYGYPFLGFGETNGL